ncbi:lymphocyte-specific protein 1 isoform X5 [Mustela putorius furo]|uniref:Lymphocyte-specific protein 1 isoform X5 n=1 Tax=Mustela putorius furo TaxID=9669 RepID=A0A8U0TEE9_MUSPF|nr:lymphocyte-specific protein 1 isoform X5 [Mustela putorius furo]
MAEAPSHPGSEEQEELLAEKDSGLTTQWSVEDEEEAARERRRRERDSKLRAQDEDGGSRAPQLPEQETLLSLKPAEAPEPDEDEGFSDWSQKPEQQQQQQHRGAGEAPWGESPEGPQEEEDRPHQHTCGSQDGDEQSPASVCLEELRLSPSSELQHHNSQQPRTPSPLALEDATEQSSPPLSPSTKLIDRTESLNRAIKKSNSVKKSQAALPISKIDERLEQYTQAVEALSAPQTAGRASRLVRQPSIELPSMAVASTKSRWETGEVQAQSTTKAPSCKDIVAGDMSKKSLWEQKGGSKAPPTMKSTPSGKRYKFVATGHGKYEKVLVDEGSGP